MKLMPAGCMMVGCKNKHHGRNLCRNHYMILYRAGIIKTSRKNPRNLIGKKFGRWVVMRLGFIGKRRERFWECRCECGTIRNVRDSALVSGTSKSCGCYRVDFAKSRINGESTNWKGGKMVVNGYVYIKKHNHPMADKQNYVAEHRYLMSKKVGRVLEKNELVHHKNGVRDDNRYSNLEIVTYSDHMGVITCPHCKERFNLR
jgi:hypothetical protein